MRRLVLPAIATAFGLAILIGLGIWQVERLAWKEALIARVTSRLDAPPVPAPPPAEWAKLDIADLQYEPVAVTGHFDNAREVYVVQPLTEPKGRLGGLGYLVMTPLTTDDGWTVYVNRGFVPTANKDPATRPGGQVEGEHHPVGPVVPHQVEQHRREAEHGVGDLPRGRRHVRREGEERPVRQRVPVDQHQRRHAADSTAGH